MEGNQFQENEDNPAKLVEILIRRKWFIISGTVGAVVLLTVLVFILPDVFRSHAVVSLGEIDASGGGEFPKGLEIPVFTRYSNVYKNPDLLKEFLKSMGYQKEWQIDADFFDAHVAPVYAFDKKSKVKQTDDSVLGVEIVSLAPGAEEARDDVGILGEYILTTILNDRVRKYLEALKTVSRTAVIRSNNAIISLRFAIENLKQKEVLINDLISTIPGIGQKADRELVNVDEKTERYLSPRQQLVAVKMAVKEHEIQIAQNLRTEKINQMLFNYVEKAAAVFKKDNFFLIDGNLLKTLMEEKENFFAGKDDDESIVASNLLAIRFLEFESLRNAGHSFISGPTLPVKPFKPKRKRLVIAGFFLAFFIFIFLSFLLEKWNDYKTAR